MNNPNLVPWVWPNHPASVPAERRKPPLAYPIQSAQLRPAALPASHRVWATVGDVTDLAQVGNTIYIAGSFRAVGPNTDGGAVLDAKTGVARPTTLCVNGPVYAAIPDGNGGWYVGGAFTQVGGITCAGVAHILSDDSLDAAWSCATSIDGLVRSLALSRTTLYC